MELPIYFNLDDFKKDYLIFFDEYWIKENEDKDFECYLIEADNYLLETFRDIHTNPENWDLRKVNAELNFSKKNFSDLSKFLYNSDSKRFAKFKNENYLYYESLRNILTNLHEYENFNDSEYPDYTTVIVMLGIKMTEIRDFIFDELLKIKCYRTIHFQSKTNQSLKKPEKFSLPQKIKILDELNIKGLLQNKGFTTFQTEQLLSDLFDKTDKTIRNGFSNQSHLKTAQDYINNLKNLKAIR